MKKENSPKRKKRPSPKVIIAVGVLILIMIATTLAMFSSTDFVTNRFEGASIDIVLREPHWNAENAKNLVPGNIIAKDPCVVNQETLDVYMFLKVTVPCDEDIILEEKKTEKGKALDRASIAMPIYKFVSTVDGTDLIEDGIDSEHLQKQKVHDSWTLVKQTVNDSKTYITYVYGYIGKNTVTKTLALVANGEQTEQLFDKIKVMNFNEKNFDPNRNYSINVKAYGIQSEYFDGGISNIPADVWAKIES